MTAADELEIIRAILGNRGSARKQVDERLRLFDQIPFVTDELVRSHIQLLPDDPQPEKIDGKHIRKATQDNVMLSHPFRVGDVVYFNIFKETAEINIDHVSDHFVGLPILEGVRQIGMALSHVLVDDLPLDTRMSLQEFSLYFYNYIEMAFPIVARGVATMSLDQDLGRDHTAFLDIRQNGVTCIAGTSSGRLFVTEDRYKKIRGKSQDLNSRVAAAFADDVRAGRGGEGGAP